MIFSYSTICKVPRKINEWKDIPSKPTCVGPLIPECIHILHSTPCNERKNTSPTRKFIPQLVLLQLLFPTFPKMAEAKKIPLICVIGCSFFLSWRLLALQCSGLLSGFALVKTWYHNNSKKQCLLVLPIVQICR